MKKDLTTSLIHRQNILNNSFALKKAEDELRLGGVLFNGLPIFTKTQVSQALGVDERTIDRVISEQGEELTQNGYKILRSIELKKFKDLYDANDKNVVSIDSKASQLGVFSFRAFLNIAMLITNSKKAKQIRTRILDIVTQVIIEKAGNTTFINQLDEDYLPAAFQEENYRKEFTSALNKYVEGNQWKYKHCTDAIYRSILADNKLTENSSWNTEMLALEFKELVALDLNFDLKITGFDASEMDLILLDENKESSDADTVPNIDETLPAVCKPGDIWQLGDHHLICGDSTKSHTYERLLGDKRADLVNVDPPYNVPVDGYISGWGKQKHAEFAMAAGEMTAEEFLEFLSNTFENLAAYSRDGSIHYVFYRLEACL